MKTKDRIKKAIISQYKFDRSHQDMLLRKQFNDIIKIIQNCKDYCYKKEYFVAYGTLKNLQEVILEKFSKEKYLNIREVK